jgi:hypothetical protein
MERGFMLVTRHDADFADNRGFNQRYHEVAAKLIRLICAIPRGEHRSSFYSPLHHPQQSPRFINVSDFSEN